MVCGAIPELERAFEHIQVEGQLFGLHLNLNKCVFWAPPAPLSGKLLSSIARAHLKEGVVLPVCPFRTGGFVGNFLPPL